MEYEIINPSDPDRMTADRLDTAAVAICLLGDGKYAAKPRGDGEEVPMFLFLVLVCLVPRCRMLAL